MLLIWKWGEILVNAVYCRAVLPEKEHRLRGEREGGDRGIYQAQEVKISGNTSLNPLSLFLVENKSK